MPKQKIALFIGRFQPIHRGHMMAIADILRVYDKVIIGVGSSQIDYTEKNPFTYTERVRLIHAAMADAGVNKKHYMIVAIPDIQTHSLWVDHVVKCIGGRRSFAVVATTSPFTQLLFEDAGYAVMHHALYKRKYLSGTRLRALILRNSKKGAGIVTPSVWRLLEMYDIARRLKMITATDNPFMR